jgi:MFS family permease
MALLPALTKQQLHAQEGVYGTLLSAVGFGAMIAAFLVATFSSRQSQRWFLVVGVGLAAGALAGLARVTEAHWAIAFCTLQGLGLILFFPTAQAIMQLSADDHNRGVIMGIWSMVFGGSVPLGGLIAGKVADKWGLPIAINMQVSGILVVAAIVLIADMLRRQWRRPIPAAVSEG